MRIVFAANTLSFLLSYKLSLAKLLISKGYLVTFVGGDDEIPAYLSDQHADMVKLEESGELEVRRSLRRGTFIFAIVNNMRVMARLFTSRNYSHLIFHTATINLAAILTAQVFPGRRKRESYFVSGFGPIRIRRAFKYRFGYRIYIYLLQLLAGRQGAKIFALNNYDHRLIQDFSCKTPVVTVREFGSDEKHLHKLQARISKSADTDEIRELKCLFVGRTLLEKGVNETIEAVSIARRLGANVRLYVIGSQDTQNKSSVDLTSLLRDSESFVHVYPEGSELDSVVSDMDVFVSSSMREGHPKYLISTMSAGLIPLVYPSPGLTRDVIHGFNGIVTSRDSPESMAAELIRLYRSPVMIRELRFNLMTYCQAYTQSFVDNNLVSELIGNDDQV